MPTVLVARQADGTFAVKVRTNRSETSHMVTVPSGFADELGLAGIPTEELVRASFAFLLDREPAEAVLPRFSLDVISRYFPEYTNEIGSHVGR